MLTPFAALIACQKKVADELIAKLQIADPNCLLAGGAPRDWYFDRPATDLDLYVHFPEIELAKHMIRFQGLGLEVIPMGTTYEEAVNGISGVYEGNYKGHRFQVIVRTTPIIPSVLMSNFNASISEAYWEDGEVKGSTRFLFSVLTRKIYHTLNKDSGKYKDKIVCKFPSYRHEQNQFHEGDVRTFAYIENIFPKEERIRARIEEKLNSK